VVGSLGLADRDPLVAPVQRRAVSAGRGPEATRNPAQERQLSRKARKAAEQAATLVAHEEATARFADTLPHRFSRPELLVEALTHRSAADPGRRLLDSNERLEFLGDRVLALVVAEWLAERFPQEREGALGKRLGVLVSAESLARVAEAMQLADALRVPLSEKRAGVVKRASVLADALEALLGALYLDGGLGPARELVRREWMPLLEESARPPASPKTRLQEWLLARGLGLPEYILVSMDGPAHGPTFYVRVLAAGRDAEGAGESKRAAEQVAAEKLLEALGG
jgi:ribonuclease-3